MNPWKIVVTVHREGEEHKRTTLSFDRAPMTIGAVADNDLVLDDPLVSGAHAHLAVSRGALVLYDHSRNGTFVGERRVERETLGPGAVVSIPPFLLALELVMEESAERATRAATPKMSGAGAFVEIQTGPAGLVGKRLPLPEVGIRLGRASDCDVPLSDPTVSRYHAELRLHPSGGWVVRDLGSANGTTVNGQRVTEASLRAGDLITVGSDLTLSFQAAGAAGAPARQTPVPDRAPRAAATQPPKQDDDVPATLRPGGPALRLRSRRAGHGGGVVVMALAGRVDGYNYTELAQALDGVVDAGEQLMVVDLGGLGFIDHTGLGVLVKAAAAIEQRGGQFRLCSLTQRLAESFSLSRLDVFFKGKIARNEQAAIADLSRFGG